MQDSAYHFECDRSEFRIRWNTLKTMQQWRTSMQPVTTVCTIHDFSESIQPSWLTVWESQFCSVQNTMCASKVCFLECLLGLVKS